jgi:hypothetical protein
MGGFDMLRLLLLAMNKNKERGRVIGVTPQLLTTSGEAQTGGDDKSESREVSMFYLMSYIRHL